MQRDTSDGEEAFRFWLRRKREQQHRERELEELKKMEEESGYVLHNREECERAFKELVFLYLFLNLVLGIPVFLSCLMSFIFRPKCPN